MAPVLANFLLVSFSRAILLHDENGGGGGEKERAELLFLSCALLLALEKYLVLSLTI